MYEQLLAKWTKRVSLISKRDQSDIWNRHILDSLQVWPHLQHALTVVDFGSGGGLPGLVIAICQKHENRSGHTTLIESDQRKCAFLRLVSVELELPTTIVTDRLEAASIQPSEIATARALASTSDLLAHAVRHTSPPHTAFFHKGRLADDELKAAAKDWSFSVTAHPSKTSADGVILQFTDIRAR